MFNLVNGKTFNLFTSLTDILSCLICWFSSSPYATKQACSPLCGTEQQDREKGTIVKYQAQIVKVENASIFYQTVRSIGMLNRL